MKKIDPCLAVLLARAGIANGGTSHGGRDDADSGDERRYPEYVHVSVRFHGDIADLRALGFDAPTVIEHARRGYTLASGSIALGRLEDLARLPHVLSIDGSVPFRPELKQSVPEVRAGPGHSPANQFTGKGVVIGVIDTGFDYRHHTFRKPDGTTRILALWDHTLTAEPARGESAPQPFNHGVEYLPDSPGNPGAPTINRALLAADQDFKSALNIVRTEDRRGHGTGVAGIAAGDGSQSGNCDGAFTYVGIAPEAGLILVKVRIPEAIAEDQEISQAFDYIFNHPAAAGKAVVINFSHGDQRGAHDGTTPLEEQIEALVTERPGRVVVKSAGNDGALDLHAEGSVAPAPGTLDLGVLVPKDRGTACFIELWYPAAGRLGVQVFPPGGSVPGNRVVQPDEPLFTLPVNTGSKPMQVIIDSDTNRVENGDNRIRILLDIDPSVQDPEVISGDWRIQLTNLGAEAVSFHGWTDGNESGPKFTSHVSRTGTLTIPGTSSGVITVGAFVHVGRGRGKAADFSSRGPTRDDRAIQKPDLVAPGRGVVSARANYDGSGCSDCCMDFYKAEPDVTRASPGRSQRVLFEGVGGTSIAAPHVAGAVALMFEKNRNQTADQILSRLRSATRKPNNITLPHDVALGTGILDVSAALNAVPGLGGGGAGGGGGGGGPPPVVAPADGASVPAGPAFARGRAGVHRETFAASMPFAELRGRALETPAGQLYAALVSRYFSEIRGLIRANRRVGAVWQRMGGPILIRHLLRRVFEPARPLPDELGGVPVASGIARFFAVLRRYGSVALKRDIERYGPLMLALEGQTLNQILATRFIAGAPGGTEPNASPSAISY